MIAAAVCLALPSSAAWAQALKPFPQDATLNSRAIRVSDLDPTSAAGARRLANRIRAAAQDVCEGGVLASATPSFHHCVEDAIARAAAMSDAPLVNAALGLSRPPSPMARR
jgi:UrcA family protein